MRTLTKTGIRVLTKRYISVLKKCAILNAMVLMLGTSPSFADDVYVSSWMGLKGAVAGDANPIYVNGNITRGASDEDITISRTLSIIGTETGRYLSGADTYKGLEIASDTNLTLENITMQNFQSNVDGGAIYNEGVISIITGVDDGTGNIVAFKGNKVTSALTNANGGAIYNNTDSDTAMDIEGDFIENSAYDGGGIYNEKGIIGSITGKFSDNEATHYGGAIYNKGTITSITGVVDEESEKRVAFKGNSADQNGGAIYNDTASNTDMDITGDFIENSAKNGGAIYNQNGTIKSITGDFESNFITGSIGGGAINNSTGGRILNIKGNFISNKANDGNGGAIYNSGEITNISGNFTNNSAKTYGGVLYNNSTTSIVNFVAENRDIKFEGNYVTAANGLGGAILNNGTVGLYAGEGDSITFVGGNETGKSDIDGIYNYRNLNINGTLDSTTYTGTVNLQAVTGAGTTNINGGTVNAAKDLTQKTVSIAENATLTTKGNVTTTSGITNAGTLNLLGGTSTTKAIINSTVSGDGTTNFGNGTNNAYIEVQKAISQAINIKANADVIANSALGASGNGFNISGTSTLTIAANNIKADVANSGTLNLGAGTLENAITGDNGSIITTGNVSSLANYLGNAVTNTTGNRLTLTGDTTTGILSKAITGTGTTVIDGIVISDNTITQDILTINEDKTLTASADKLDITTTLTNNGTLVTDGNLNHLSTLTNNGTVQIATGKELNVFGDKNLGGTLDLNGQTLNMQEQGETPVAYSTLTVGTLKGTGKLLIDANVNETNKNADKIAYTNADSAVINLTNINVREGFTTHTTDAKDNYLTVLNGSGATFNVGESGSTSTQFGDYLYTFEKGTTEGTLKVTEEFNTNVSLADYITGTEKGRIIDTYSFANNETLIEAITTGSVSAEKNPYTIGMNGKDLTGSNTNGITISTEKTLTVDGNGGTISGFNTALINEGTLNLKNVEFSGNTTDVSNAGTLCLIDNNTFGSKLTGTTGTVTNSGTLNISATNLDVALTNNGTLNLEGGTLGKAVTGLGTITAKGDVSSNASYLGNAVTNTDHTLTLTEGILTQAITGGNVTIAGDVTSDASIASAIGITENNKLTINADNVGGAVTNAGTLTLTGGQLDKAITGGDVAITGDVTSNASIASAIGITENNKLTINADNVGGAVTNAGTLTLTGGQLDKAITGGGVAIDDVVTSNASIASAIKINESLTIGANNVGGDVSNSGILNLDTGTLAQNVNGEGTTNINGDVVVAANKDILNTVKIAENSSLELNAGLIDTTKANITENLGRVIMNGGTLSSDVAGVYETKVGGSAVTTTTAYLNDNFTNKGTLNLTSDIDKDIKGNGMTVLSKEGSYVSVIGNRIIDGTLNTNGKSINMQSLSSSVSYDTLSVGTLNLGSDISLMLDSNIVTQEIDKISATSVTGDGKINVLLNIPSRIDTVLTNPSITLDPINMTEGRTALAKALRYEGHSITSPIFEYTTSYDENTGLISIKKKSGTDGINKSLYSSTAIAQTTASTVAQIANIAMDKLDMATYDELQGLAGGDMPKASNAWVKVMGFDDDVDFKHFNTIDSKAYTLAGGFNTDKVRFADVDAAFGIYGGYIGGRQKYTGNKIEQDGGYIGLSSELKKENAFLISTVNSGFINNEAENMYGTDKFDTRWLGVGLKGGYNYALTDTWTLQPNVYAGYTFVNTEDYTSKSGVKVKTDNLHFFEIDPGFKLSKQIDKGWIGYIQGKYAIVMDNGGDTKATDIALPDISHKNYFEYGFGMNKSLTDAWSLNGEINRRDGGRTGWNGAIEFKYNF